MSLNNGFLLFLVLESVYFICCRSITKYCHFSRFTLNSYEQPGEIHDSIKQVKSTQRKFENDIIISR